MINLDDNLIKYKIKHIPTEEIHLINSILELKTRNGNSNCNMLVLLQFEAFLACFQLEYCVYKMYSYCYILCFIN